MTERAAETGAAKRRGPKHRGPARRSCSTALSVPKRQDHWCRRLADSGQEEESAPAHERLEELRAEVTDLERRIERQVANLEAEDATPSMRVGARIAELEEALDERRQHAKRSPPKYPKLRRLPQISPARSAGCRSSQSGFRTCPSRNSGRCSTACSCRSPSSHRRARSTLRSRSSPTSSETATAKRRRSGPCARQDSNLRPTD
jgi:hypothetical protein